MFYEIINIPTWDEVKEYFNDLLNKNQFWIFRGHYKSEWRLQPTLERTLSRQPIDIEIESKIISEFKRRAHQYLSSNFMPGNLLEWLALMQHHGAPTRMLDWSKSPYVSAFVAFENTYKEEGNVAIWAIDSLWLNKNSASIIKKANKNGLDIILKKIKTDQELLKLIHAEVNVILPMEPNIMNERLTIQQGLFLFPSGKTINFENILENYGVFDSSKFIKKIIIPYSEGLNCLVDLNRMNINAATLFPGLDGFARSLKNIPDIMYGNVYKDMENNFNF